MEDEAPDLQALERTLERLERLRAQPTDSPLRSAQLDKAIAALRMRIERERRQREKG